MQSQQSTDRNLPPPTAGKLSKIGLMRQIESDIFKVSGILYPDRVRMKTTVDRIEILARWPVFSSPDLKCRKQTMLACGSLLYHIQRSFAQMGWKAEIRLFPKLDREDVLAYIRAGSRATGNISSLSPETTGAIARSEGDCICDEVTLKVEKNAGQPSHESVKSYHFKTLDDDSVAWIRTGKTYASLVNTINAEDKARITIPEPEFAIHTNGVTWFTQLIVE
jgi:hypothetical protein